MRDSKSNKLLRFAKIFQRWLFLIFEFSNYQTLIKAYINSPYKKNRNFQRFWKKVTWKKDSFIVSRTALCTQTTNFCMQKKFSKNISVQNSICGWKKKQKNFGAIFQNYLKKFCVAIKKCLSYSFHIRKLCGKYFFFKNYFKSVFFHQSVQLFCSQKDAEMVYFFLLISKN